MNIDQLLQTVPPVVVYLLTGLVIGIESLGVPMPGEIVLVSASLLSSRHALDVSPVWVAVAATVGAVVGDSIGYALGRRYGTTLLERLGRRFPRHLGPERLDAARRLFARWGAWAVFFGRFVALLRIFAGPLAGALAMPYRRFLIANVAGGICWAGGTTAAVYTLGLIAETWLKRFSWIGLVIAVVVGPCLAWIAHRRVERSTQGVTSSSRGNEENSSGPSAPTRAVSENE